MLTEQDKQDLTMLAYKIMRVRQKINEIADPTDTTAISLATQLATYKINIRAYLAMYSILEFQELTRRRYEWIQNEFPDLITEDYPLQELI